MPYLEKQLYLSQISLNPENPRYEEEAENEGDAIQKMIKNQGKKLIELASDIVENGLNPLDRIGVVELEENDFKVLEGNRRAVALKLLEDPSIIENENIRSQFENFNKKFKEKGLDKEPYTCVKFDSEEEGLKWMERIHGKNQKGKSREAWGNIEEQRFQDRTKGKTDLAYQVFKFLRENSSEDDDIDSHLRDMGATNIGRIMGDPDLRRSFGLDRDKGVLYSKYTMDEAFRVLKNLVNYFIQEGKTVQDIKNKNNRRDFIKEFPSESLTNNKFLTSPWRLDTPPNTKNFPVSNSNEEIKESQEDNVTKSKYEEEIPLSDRPQVEAVEESQQNQKGENLQTSVSTLGGTRPNPRSRRYLIPSNFQVNINNQKLATVFKELKQTEISESEHCVALGFRVFIEGTLKKYADLYNVQEVGERTNLNRKISAVCNHLKGNNFANGKQLFQLERLASDPNTIFSINTLNQVAHNLHFTIHADHLKTLWDNIAQSIQILWGKINEKE